MNEHEGNPAWLSVRNKLQAIDGYLTVLNSVIPEAVAAYTPDVIFNSLDALENIEASIVYVCMILRKDFEYHLQRVIDGEYAPHYSIWLFTLKTAIRTADHVTDELMDNYPEDFKGFGYTCPPETEVQRTWSVLMFACDELGKSIAMLEDYFSGSKALLDYERQMYRESWLAHLEELNEMKLEAASLQAQIQEISESPSPLVG